MTSQDQRTLGPLVQFALLAGPLASSQATMLIVDPIASIALGAELFHEPLSTSPGHAIGAVAALAVLAAGVVALSAWAPPVMTAPEVTAPEVTAPEAAEARLTSSLT